MTKWNQCIHRLNPTDAKYRLCYLLIRQKCTANGMRILTNTAVGSAKYGQLIAK